MKKYKVTVEGKTYEVEVEEVAVGSGILPAKETVSPGPRPQAKAVSQSSAAPAQAETALPEAAEDEGTTVVAQMPGAIIAVHVKPGDAVSAGDVLLVMEAMKMEQDVKAPVDGTVSRVLVSKGDAVNGDDVLVIIS